MPRRSWESRRALIAGNFLFEGLRDDELDKVLALAQLKSCNPRQVIWRKGDPGDGMVAVLSGHVKLSTLSTSGNEMAYGIIKPGKIFGEIALLDGYDRSVDATAIDSCEILFIKRCNFIPFLMGHPEIAIRLMVALCARLRRASQRLEDSDLGLASRLAKSLLGLADQYGRPAVGGGTRVDLKLSQRELGALIGMSRESVNKQLGFWRLQGLIGLERKTITIRNPDLLRRIVDQAQTLHKN